MAMTLPASMTMLYCTRNSVPKILPIQALKKPTQVLPCNAFVVIVVVDVWHVVAYWPLKTTLLAGLNSL